MESLPQDKPSRIVPNVIIAGVVLILVTGFMMVRRAEGKTNKIALASTPQLVGVVEAKASSYRASRTYGGTFESWVEAGVGPQRVSAYVDAVLVRPGASVKRGDVLATLDCREASAESRAIAQRARALSQRQQAVSNEAARIQEVLKKGTFVSENEAEQALAQSAQEQAQVSAEQAKLAAFAVAVDDCILRAPFDGEIARRVMDPGGFARPGAVVATVVDRGTVRFVADAPESDYDVVAQGSRAHVHVDALNLDLDGVVARRTPSGDTVTRTVRFEIDVATGGHEIPANTTGEVRLSVGDPRPATEVPLVAASVRDKTANVFVVETKLAPGTQLVASGRALLADGDHVDTAPRTKEVSR